MDFSAIKKRMSHGNGSFHHSNFKIYGNDIIIETGVLIFHPENISIYDHVYIGHNTILKGYFNNTLILGEGTWIGQNCFFHAAGGIIIGKAVGIGPNVKIITSTHESANTEIPVIHSPLVFGKVEIGDGADIGVGTIILPDVTIGEGAIVGAGSVVTKNIDPYTVYAGSPAKFLRNRK